MKSLISFVGILLIIFGIFTLVYKGFNYTSHEKVAEIGSLQVSADKEKSVYLSPTTGGLSIVVGIFLILIGRSGRKD